MNEEIISGNEIAKYIISITPNKELVPYSWLSQYVEPNNFVLKTIDIKDIMDEGVIEYIKAVSETGLRYKFSDMDGIYVDEEGLPADNISDDSIYNPIVMVNGMVVDGYSRIATLISLGADSVEAFVNI